VSVVNDKGDNEINVKLILLIVCILMTGIIIFFIASRLQVDNVLDDTDMIPHMNASFIIPENELPQKILNALAGDPVSSSALARHYSYGRYNYNESLYWHIIGTENGNFETQYGLVYHFLYTNNDEMKTRGIFWLYMLAKDDYRETRGLLEVIGYSLDTARPPDDENFSNDYLQLSETEIVLCKKGALQGNKKAAQLLGKYYEKIEINRELSKYWYRIGTQNGDIECQYILSQILLAEDDELAQIRGLFWMKKLTTQ
jgi:TPR repeat protein